MKYCYTNQRQLDSNDTSFSTIIKSLTIFLLCICSQFSISVFALKLDESHKSKDYTSVGTGPYFGLGTTFKGESLVILQPSLHKDLALLKQNQQMLKSTGRQHGLANPYVQMSGLGEIQSAFETQARNSLLFSAAILDIDAWINDWMNFFTQFGIDVDEIQNNNFRMILGFVTIGNLNKSPFYASLGQMFVPFGSFSTGTSDMGTLTRAIGRIYQRAFSIGYYPGNGFHLTGSAYNAKTRNSSSYNVDQFAATASYKTNLNIYNTSVGISGGASYTNNIAEAAAMRGVFNQDAILSHYVAGVDLFGRISVDPFIFRGEFITALRNFSSIDILQANNPIKPNGFLLEAEYDTYLFGNDSWLTFHYSDTQHAAAASNVQHQLGLNAGMYIFKNTIFSLEYSHRKSYSKSNFISNDTINQTATTAMPLFGPLSSSALNSKNLSLNGRERNVLIGTLDVFF